MRFFSQNFLYISKKLRIFIAYKQIGPEQKVITFVLDTKRLHSLFFYLFALFFGKLIFIISYKERIVNQDGH